MNKVIFGIFVVGLIAVGALDAQKTVTQVTRVIVTMLGGQPEPLQGQQYEFPVQSDRYAPASNQGTEQ